MTFVKQKFAENDDLEFFSILRKRVSTHFEANQRSRHGNWNMKMKSVVMFSLYFAPFFILLSGAVTNTYVFMLLWVMIGFGMAGIGLSVMHDANHRSYSSKGWVNKMMGYSMNVIGANSEIWKLQHNLLHHTYTNIEGVDDDIHTPSFLRFSPYKEKRWIHKYQYIYVWFFYGISTLSWVTTKEFMQLYRYRKLGLIEGRKKFRSLMRQLILWKVFYYLYIMVLPIILIPVSPWLIVLSFIIMHFITGLTISSIFQTAHVMPNCDYPVPDHSGRMENSWAVHEMMTTTNYSPKSRIFTWLIGGLNFQIEHHLFPSICHVHYKQISKIVESTANELGVPYHTNKNFVIAIRNHVKMLYELGRCEKKELTV